MRRSQHPPELRIPHELRIVAGLAPVQGDIELAHEQVLLVGRVRVELPDELKRLRVYRHVLIDDELVRSLEDELLHPEPGHYQIALILLVALADPIRDLQNNDSLESESQRFSTFMHLRMD